MRFLSGFVDVQGTSRDLCRGLPERERERYRDRERVLFCQEPPRALCLIAKSVLPFFGLQSSTAPLGTFPKVAPI